MSKIDGNSIGVMTYACMRRVMTDELAVKYSWSGQPRRGHPTTIGFNNFLICQLIKRKYFVCKKIIYY